jgi:hypothetical protein
LPVGAYGNAGGMLIARLAIGATEINLKKGKDRIKMQVKEKGQ